MQDKEKKTYEPGDVVDLDQEFIVISIPDDTLELTIKAKIYINGELHDVTRHMDFPEVRAAIREARDGYTPSDALFTLCETGDEKIADLLHRYINHIEEE